MRISVALAVWESILVSPDTGLHVTNLSPDLLTAHPPLVSGDQGLLPWLPWDTNKIFDLMPVRSRLLLLSLLSIWQDNRAGYRILKAWSNYELIYNKDNKFQTSVSSKSRSFIRLYVLYRAGFQEEVARPSWFILFTMMTSCFFLRMIQYTIEDLYWLVPLYHT